MSEGIASLHKILKDETRRKILLSLNERQSVSYTELLGTTKTGSTGILNYHLKLLGDLVAKNESGQYILTEKGKLASRLIIEFPEDRQVERKINQKRLFMILLTSQVIYLATISTLYLLGIIEFYRVILATSYFIMATIVIYFGYRMQRKIPISGSKEERSRMSVGYVVGGVWLGLIIAFFFVGFLIRGLQEITHQPFLHNIFWTDWYLGFSLLIAPAIGGVAGYYFGKKRGFQKPKWAIWLDNRL